MAEGRLALLEGTGLALPEEPRLRLGRLDLRRFAGLSRVVAPGAAAVELASRHIDGRPPEETHKSDRTPMSGFESTLTRLNRWRQTLIGRTATVIVLAGPALAACGPGNHGNVAGDRPPAAAGAGALEGGQGGDGEAPKRVIIGDAACYDGFEKLDADAQAACAEAFTGFSMDQVKQLSPLDQARWAYDVHHKITGGEDGERLNWTRALETHEDATTVANAWLNAQGQDVMELAWMMQQPDQKALANEERTWAAFFGIGTTADSASVKDAKTFAEKYPSGGMDINAYMRYLITKNQLYGNASNVKSVKTTEGGYTLTFTADHYGAGGNNTETFSVSFMPYLELTSEGDKFAFRSVDDNKEATEFHGKPLIGIRVPNA